MLSKYLLCTYILHLRPKVDMKWLIIGRNNYQMQQGYKIWRKINRKFKYKLIKQEG